MIEQPYHQPSEVAKLLGVSAFTVRRWCEWHSAYLSPSANPSPGRPRRLSAQDVEVMRHVAQLRTQGLTTVEINAQLEGKTFAVVESELQHSPTEAPQLAPETHSTALAQNVGIDATTALQALVGRLDAIERTQRDRFTWFLYGFLACGVLFGLMLLLAVLYGR